MCVNQYDLVRIPDWLKEDPLCYSGISPDGGEVTIDGQGRECLVIDSCLVLALRALWAAGVKTTTCCCGHGTGSGVIGILTDYNRGGIRITEAPPYSIIEVVERRRHENDAYQRGRHDGLVAANREDLALAEAAIRARVEKEP
jgi:hypothetical protein